MKRIVTLGFAACFAMFFVSTLAHASWQDEWDATIAAAKNEGKLVIYTGVGSGVKAAFNKFGEKFGINIEYTTGSGQQLAEKISIERRAGLYLADLFVGGMTTPTTQLKPAGFLAPIRPLLMLPEVLDTKAYFDNKLPFADKEGTYVLYYAAFVSSYLAVNSNLVKPGEIKGYSDLLQPKWKGKIVFNDPTMGGAGNEFFLVTAFYAMTPDFHRQLVKQEPVISRDRRLQVEWVARGKYAAVLGPTPDVVAEFQKVGAPIQFVYPTEGAVLGPGGTATFVHFSRAPHPNASKAFLNWIMTKEGLTIWSQASLNQSVRKDLPTDFLAPEGLRKPGIKYIVICNEGVQERGSESAKLAKEIYGPLLK